MMTQEEFMDVVALRRQGWTITDIAAEDSQDRRLQAEVARPSALLRLRIT